MFVTKIKAVAVWRRAMKKQEKSLYNKAPCQANMKRKRELKMKQRQSIPLLQSQICLKKGKKHSTSANDDYRDF